MPDGGGGGRGAPRFGVVILAAGGSTRMGSPKQLLEVDGVPLVARAVDAALASNASGVAVVLGADAERVCSAVAGRPVIAVINPEWRSGMASSIRAGLEALLEADPDSGAVLIAPCDQPALSAETINALAALHGETGRVAAARYSGRNGAPAVFGRVHFPALRSLAGDEGARALLNGGAIPVSTIDAPELAADLDTPSDAGRWAGDRRPGRAQS